MQNLETIRLTPEQEEQWEREWASSVESRLGVSTSRKFHRLRFINALIEREEEEREQRERLKPAPSRMPIPAKRNQPNGPYLTRDMTQLTRMRDAMKRELADA